MMSKSIVTNIEEIIRLTFGTLTRISPLIFVYASSDFGIQFSA